MFEKRNAIDIYTDENCLVLQREVYSEKEKEKFASETMKMFTLSFKRNKVLASEEREIWE